MKLLVRINSILAFLVILLSPLGSAGQDLQPLSISLEGYAYPYAVNFLDLKLEGQEVKMAYMDVKPEGKPNGRTLVLFHGKNFPGAYWKDTIRFLSQNGFRVVAPDQIGFGKSSKPDIHYSFHLLAANTKQLLDHLDIKKAAVLGHSMGGMLATRVALMYPETVTHLILENPIGLEDYRVSVPYAPLEALYAAEMKASEESIRKYHQTYYVEWKPKYDDYVKMAARQRRSGEYPRLALASALTYLMIYEQPVCHEFSQVKAKALLLIGQADRTVVGKARVPKELLPQLGQYPALGKKTAKLMPNATLVEIPNVGHVPHFEAPARFHQELLAFLSQPEAH
jgi:pimeloyl-ACP methyl ester carboxylesterase